MSSNNDPAHNSRHLRNHIRREIIIGTTSTNIFSMVVGILALVFYNDIAVKDYFARLNGTLTPEPFSTPPSPASPPEPEPAPVMEELPQPEETPAPAKRIRKMAK
jgi:hypothetical protein